MSRRFFSPVTGAVDALLGGWFQSCCHICGTPCPGEPVCRRCRETRSLGRIVCERCGLELPAPMKRCGECSRWKRPALTRVRSLFWYDESARAILHKVKFAARFELLDVYREAVSKSEETAFSEAVVIAVPLDSRRYAARGFNQAEKIAGWVRERVGTEAKESGLVKIRETPPQSTLPMREREKILSTSYAWHGRAPAPERVLLVDDVYTTGATLEACARALLEAGTEEVHAWTLFRAPPPR